MLLLFASLIADSIICSEEMAEDVRVRMYAIQENELDLLRALTTSLDDEVHFVEQYLEVLKEAKAAWIDRCVLISILQAHPLKSYNSIKRNSKPDGFGQKTTTSAAARVRLSFWLSTLNEVSVEAFEARIPPRQRFRCRGSEEGRPTFACTIHAKVGLC